MSDTCAALISLPTWLSRQGVKLALAGLLLLALAGCQQTTETAVTGVDVMPTAEPEIGFELARFHAEIAFLLQQGLRVSSTETISDQVTWSIVIESIPSVNQVRMVFQSSGPSAAEIEIASSSDRLYLRGKLSGQQIDWVTLPASGDEKSTLFAGAPGLALLTAERLLKAWDGASDTVDCGQGRSCYSLTSASEPGIELHVDEETYRLVSYSEASDNANGRLRFAVEWADDLRIELPAEDAGQELDAETFGNVFVNLLAAVTTAGDGAEPADLPEIAPGNIAYLETGRRLIGQFYAGDVELLWGLMNEEARTAFGSSENLATARATVLESFGPELLIYEEYISRVGEFEIYERIAQTERGPGPVSLRLAFADDGRIAGFDADFASTGFDPVENPNASISPLTTLQLPFDEQFLVEWGGRRVEQNRYAIDPRQRFGYDFVLAQGNSLYRGDGAANEDYFCYGSPVLAPAGGSVVSVVGNRPDNDPGSTVYPSEYGNYVVLAHSDGEFGFLTNLRADSISVVEGQIIETGDKVGECGNSGASSTPHIHLHLQDAADPIYAFGIPARFTNYQVAGFGPVAVGEPTSGQTISNRR